MSCIQPAFFLARQLGREVWVDDAGDAWLRPDLLMESAVSDLATKELTFVMSWAMRHILPARDSEARLHDAPVSARLSVAVTKIWYHSLVSYYALLNRSYMRKTGQHDPQLMILCRYREVSSARANRMFPSAFRGESSVREAGLQRRSVRGRARRGPGLC